MRSDRRLHPPTRSSRWRLLRLSRLLAARLGIGAGLLAAACGVAAAPARTLASYPLFLAPPLSPNLLVLLDNSGSMDATMSGKVISGDNPDTRGNIARSVLRSVIDGNRAAFNWGLGTFELSGGPVLYNTLAYFLGSASTMVYTNSCSVPIGSASDVTGYSVDGPQTVASAAGVTPVVYKNNCLQNPDVDASGAPRNSMRYLTFEVSGDDAAINDVFYTTFTGAYAYGVGISQAGFPNRYKLFSGRDDTIAWTLFNFTGCLTGYCPVDFTPTDAGFLPFAAAMPRALYIKRGWGWGAGSGVNGDSGITGRGRIAEPVTSSARGTPAEVATETAHYNALMTALAPETINNGAEIKNAVFVTPLAGSVQTARDYFAGRLSGAAKSPIAQSCQRNYVVLATDGNPTGKPDGTLYQPSEWLNTRDAGGNWVYGPAQAAVFDQVGTLAGSGTPNGGLRATTLTGNNLTNPALAGRTFDIQTYVIGLGDTVANESSVASLNRMAKLGGGYPEAFLGTSSASVQAAFQTIVTSIQKKRAGASSATLNAAQLGTDTTVYQATFDSSDWSGDLRAYGIGSNGKLAATATWGAAARVSAQDWSTGRTILTARPAGAPGPVGIAFRWPLDPAAPTVTELDASQIDALSTAAVGVTDNFGKQRLSFLRGNRSQEGARCGGCATPFRDRSTPLGDVVNSAPLLVGAPSATYYDDIEASPYSAFRATYRNRPKVIYVGANDGMLHGFDAATGAERLAYVPSPLYPRLNALTTPGYDHRFFVDGSPAVGDVFYGGGWKSLLVAGMRAGAKGIYALDVTDPAGFSEAAASSIVRWQFVDGQDADIGYVYSQPVLAKTRNGRWSVVVGNGYNSGSASGHAVLYVLDAETGAVTRKIDTGAGSAASPNGLSGPAVIDADGDGIADTVYAGDLNGNLWKFDLSAATPANWGIGNGGVALYATDPVNPNAGTQPITDRPNVTQFPRGGFMVVFGTGSYLSTADASSTTTQSLYGVWDNLLPGTVAPAALVPQSVGGTATGADGALYRATTHVVGTPVDALVPGDLPTLPLVNYYGNKRGWRLDLPTAGERAVTDARIRGGRAIFTTLIPNTADPCAYGGSGWLMELDVITGNRDSRGTFDTDNSGSIDAADNLAFTGGGTDPASGRFFSEGIPAAPATLVRSSPAPGANTPPGTPGCTEVRYVARSDGTTTPVLVACGAANFGRAQWRELR